MRRLGLQFCWSAQRVELRIGLPASDVLGHEDVDGDAVLGVHHDHRPGLGGVLHRPQDLAVIGVEHPGIRHEQLEAGDALVVDEVRHCLQRLVVDTADDLVEAVVDRTVAGGLLVPHRQLILHAEAGVLHGEVDDRGHPAPGRSARAGLERVGRLGATERQLHVRVDVDAAGHDVLVRGVDGAVGGDAHRCRLTWREDRDDLLAVDQHVGFATPDRRDDRAALDQRGAHDSTNSP